MQYIERLSHKARTNKTHKTMTTLHIIALFGIVLLSAIIVAKTVELIKS